MKIGVISSYACIKAANNYGAVLQYFALQEYLKRRGHEVFWIRSVLSHSGVRIFLRHVKHYRSLPLLLRYYECHKTFFDFIGRYLNLSPSIYRKVSELARNCPSADVYVAGSDQVWGGIQPENYLRFVSENNKKIAYAASFGSKRLTPLQLATIPQWIREFRAVSVRESSGVEICRQMGVYAVHLLDPTLLLDAADYPAADSGLPEGGMFCYLINLNNLDDVCFDAIEEYAATNGLPLKVVSCQYSEVFFNRKYLLWPSPQQWLGCYKAARCIVTNTFHGTVFALVYHKPFVAILQGGAYSTQNERIISLLETFNLQHRILRSKQQLGELLETSIDWAGFEVRKSEMKEKTDAFFRSVSL